jgi:GAF domain-containing protein/HAMP domain-containing protein
MAEQPNPPTNLGRPTEVHAGTSSSVAPSAPSPREAIMVQTARIAAIAEVITAGLYGYLYSQTHAWQILAAAGLATAALIGSLVALRLAGRRPRAARVVLLFLFVLAYSSGEWIFSDLTVPLAVTGTAVIVALGGLLFSRRFWIWFGAGALFAGNILAARSLQFFDRYRLLRNAPINPYVPFAAIALIVLVATVWQAVRTLRTGTIRARLLVSYVGTTLLVAAVISIGAILGAFFTGQQRTEAQLQSVAVLKEQEIEAWLRGLQTDLSLALTGDGMVELATAVLGGTASEADYEAVVATLERVSTQSGRFEEISLLDTQGRVVLGTEGVEVGTMRSNQIYFREGLQGPYVQRPYYSSSLMRSTVMAARPVQSSAGEVVGVIAGRASMGALNEIMAERTGLGQTGETYLVGPDYTLLTPTRFGDRQVYVGTAGVVDAIGKKASGSGLYDNYRAEPVVGAYRWIPGLQVALLAEQGQTEALRVVYLLLGLIGGVALLSVLFAVGASLAITRGISVPLSNLADTATRIAAGELDLTPQVERQDEIGALAGALAAMTGQVRELIHDLERRVTLRTRELEQRSSHLEAAASIGSVVTSILDTNLLMAEVVRQIREQFDFYYVGLFLVEPGTEWATLRSGTGEAGQAMMERGHRIRLGTGMVGWTISHGAPRIMLEAGDDAVQLSTPELPETRSEAAIPLRSRGRVLGAFSIQDDEPGRFDHDLLAILTTVADQVAIALDNAELFAARQATLEAEHRAFGELSHQEWLELARSRPHWGYRYADQTLAPAAGDWEPELEQALRTGALIQTEKDAAPTLSVPLAVRGNPIGAVSFRRHRGDPDWSNEEIELLEGLVEQLGDALENARLQQQARTRAVREQLVADVAAQMRRSLDVEAVLRTAAERIRDVLALPEVTVRLAPEPSHRPGGNGHSRTDRGS